MPRLKPLQWLLVVLFLFYYGFAVFAVTRDYYTRQLPATATPASPHGAMPAKAAAATPVATPAAPITETDPEQLHQQADSLFVQRDFSGAARYYERIIALNPEDAEAFNDLGLALYYTGDTSAALARLETAVTKAPELQRPWLTLGFVRFQSGELGLAREALERARDLDPASDIGAEAQRLLGLLDQPAGGG